MDQLSEIATSQPGHAGQATPGDAAGALPAQACRFTFTGSGKEYFRIWIVNLLLTVATLGIYSAWAKVRRLQYFDRNTQLAGASFDFRGDPRAILRGRMLAVVVVAAYHYLYGYSPAAWLAVVALLFAALPFLFRAALRFRLSNTWYRGLPFGFSGSVTGAYRAWLPPVAVVLLPGALAAFYPGSPAPYAALLLYLSWPLMYGVMKRYQHRHLVYGGAGSRFEVPVRRFAPPYLRAGLLALAGLAVIMLVAVALIVLAGWWHGPVQNNSVTQRVVTLALTAVPAYLFFLLAGPYLKARLANLAWSDTSFPGVGIACQMKAGAFVRLQTVNAVLTLLSLGLYRPFAVVNVYRYRLAHLALEVQGDFELAVGGTARGTGGASGDGVADFLGVDLSW
jgi:uncharacterized membrane protein YjgN (DUF898 family)